MSFIKDTTRFYIISGHNKSWASAMDIKEYLGGSGATGEKGEDGDSAYQVAVNAGFIGTVDEWLASLKGERGEQGPQGLQGLKGEQGLQGSQGEQGNTGSQGEQGLKGEKGDTGEQGPRGMQGEVGAQGPQGLQGPQGVQGSKGDTGNGFSLTKVYPSVADMEADVSNPDIPENSFVLINSSDEDNGKLYVKHGGAYVYQSQLAGVKGDKGDQGEQGIQGIQGPKGDTGVKGEEGIQGPKGDKGDVGQQGLAGPQGPRGIQGPQGIRGEKGDQGEGVTVSSSTSGITSDVITEFRVIKQGRVANITCRISPNGLARGANTYERVGTLPAEYVADFFQKATITGSGKTISLDVYENGNIFVVWDSSFAVDDNTKYRFSMTYFTKA